VLESQRAVVEEQGEILEIENGGFEWNAGVEGEVLDSEWRRDEEIYSSYDQISGGDESGD